MKQVVGLYGFGNGFGNVLGQVPSMWDGVEEAAGARQAFLI
jgi:hypothetical protein